MKLARYAVATVVILVFAIIMLNYRETSIRKSGEMIDKINAEFLLMEKSDQLYDRIEELYCPPKIRCVGQAWLILSGGKKVRIIGHGYGETVELANLQSGDSIIKRSASDTIWIHRLHKSDPVFFLISDK